MSNPASKATPRCLAAALDYLSRGWAPLTLCPPDHQDCTPQHCNDCKSPGKAPLWPWKQYQDKLPEEKHVRMYFARNPAANVGIALGPVSGLIALDVDGEPGEQLLIQLAGTDLPDTLEYSTGHGYRLFYRCPAEVPPIRSIKLNGSEALRVLSKGSQTVAPPSRHASGVEYQWVVGNRPGEIEAAPCPQWLIDLMRKDGHGTSRPADPSSPPNRNTTNDDVRRALAYLASCHPAISGQGGHNQTFKVAVKLVKGFSLPPDLALELLLRDYNPRCQPPWTEKELRHKVESAAKADSPEGFMYQNMRAPNANGPYPGTVGGRTDNPSSSKPDKQPHQATILTLADVQPKSLEWLMPGWIPKGKLTILDGDPDLGKSTMLLDLAARVSTSGQMPNGEPGLCGDVIILSAEDDAEDTIVPRLLAAGADLSRCQILTDINGQPPVIPYHLDAIETAIADHKAKLLIIDPLTAYIDADACSDQKVRRALHPLKRSLQKTACSAVALRHLNKGGGTKALYRGGGSIAIIGAARAGMLVAQDPDNPLYRVVAQTKHNLAQLQSSLRYTLEWIDAYQACRVAWITGRCPYGADDLLKPPEDKEEKSVKEEAIAFLKAFLANGPQLATDVYQQAKELKIGDPSALRRAKSALGVKTKPIKDPDGKLTGWQWSLKEEKQ